MNEPRKSPSSRLRQTVIGERSRYKILASAILFAGSSLINCLVVLYRHPPPTNQGETTSVVGRGNGPQEQRMGDGCYHIFLDVGANIGVHSRFLFEPFLYPNAKDAINLFNEQFGNSRDNRDFCTFAFEPNPAHISKHQATVRAYNAQGWRHHALNVGVSDEDGTMTFYRNDENGENSEWGFSVKKLGSPNKEVETVSVPVIRLAKWIETHIIKRSIPTATYGAYKDGPKVLMKMDIEGMENLVLPDLMFTGAMCSVDLIFGEFHPGFGPLHFPGHRVNLDDWDAIETFGAALMKVMHSSRNCNTTFLYLDDESYVLDGLPLPSL